MKLLPNHLTELLSIQYPIIQAPMFGVSTPEMTAAASNFGALGSLALGDLASDQCAILLDKVLQNSNKPFAANIFVNEIPQIDMALKEQYQKVKNHLHEILKLHNIELELPAIEDLKFTDYHDQIDIVIQKKCSVLSFTFGTIDMESIEKLRRNNVLTIGTCVSVQEAIDLEKLGIDIVCVQDIDAGGHRGSFLSDGTNEANGLGILQEIKTKLSIPVVYAGGIYNATTYLNAKEYGADGVQMGSIFLCSDESSLLPFEKEKLQQSQNDETVLTRVFSGRYARGIKNAMTENVFLMENALPYPYQNKLTGTFRKAFKKIENTEYINLWVGDKHTQFPQKPIHDILSDFIYENHFSKLKSL